MGAIVMDNAIVEKYGFVAAGAVVPPGKIVKSGELWAGLPAQRVRTLTEDDIRMIKDSAMHYMRLAEDYITRS
jgi:carbonic anhydrase/acetyltransferase-like protein (isoleucine patch superfamily)